MLTILLGTHWVANRDRILQLVADDVKNCKENRLLIVPELISHDTERRLAAVAGDTASRYAQVVTFSRLVRAVSEFTGCSPIPCLDKGGRVVAMAAAVRQLNSKLKSYASVQSRPEFLTGLLDAVDEFKRCCISAADLRGASARSEGEFAQKLEELALILESYDAITSVGNRDPRDQMNWLLEQIEACDFAESHSFYITGFPDFTRQHAAILEHLVLNSPAVTIAFTCDFAGSKALAFEKAGASALELISFAKSNRIEYRIAFVDAYDSPLTTAQSRLFQGSTECIEGISSYLQPVQAESIHSECRYAAKRILELVQKGTRYRDIGIVCTNVAAYENALRLVFTKSGIPFYRSGCDDVLQKNVFDGLFLALHAALEGFDRQDILRYMRSMLCGLDTDICDKLENYAIIWRISGKQWLTDWTYNPQGLTERWTRSDRELLEQLNLARKKLIDPLSRLSTAFHAATCLGQQIRALADFLEDIDLAGRLQELADYMDSQGDNRSAQILDQLWEILISALEQLYDVLGSGVWDTEGFCRLLRLLLSQYDVGTIPTVLDSVSVGAVTSMRCHQVRHLLVLGAREGQLPTYGGVTGILSDREREQLRELDVPLTGGGMEGLKTEFSEIYEVFSSADSSLSISCSDGQPSFIFGRLASMAGSVLNYTDSAMDAVTDPIEAASYFAAVGAKRAATALGIGKEYGALNSSAHYTHGKISAEHIRSLYGDQLELSASQIDKQANCRFSYFLRYGLHTQEVKEASIDPAQFGTYFHAVLEKTCDEVMRLGGFHEVSLENTIELALKYSEEYIRENFGQLDSARMQYLFGRNVEELKFLIDELWQELHVSAFEPTLFEVGFGQNDELPPVEIEGAAIPARLRGYVDRVDQWHDGHNNYFRVVDYKSGKKSFDYCDVFNGMGLQMLLYMYALEKNGAALMGSHPIPVGVQYFAARFPFEASSSHLEQAQADDERGKTLKRKGLLLRDEAVLTAMQPEGAPQRLNVKIKNGNITGDCADRGQFDLLRKYVFHILRDLVGQIDSGDVSPNPYTRGAFGACSYCPYGSICHKATVSGRRDYKTMDSTRFWDEVTREVEQNG